MPRDEHRNAGHQRLSHAYRDKEDFAREDKRDAWRDGPLGKGLPFTLAFGRHKGKTLDKVPVDYQEWLVTQKWISPVTAKAVWAFLSALPRPQVG